MNPRLELAFKIRNHKPLQAAEYWIDFENERHSSRGRKGRGYEKFPILQRIVLGKFSAPR
jgi:hypothetical protein